jgi:septal ring-binding cell division protein DamX
VKITIKQIQGILLSNLMVLTLAACSSSPSPWSQQDNSPWKAKRVAEESSVASEEFVEVPLDEPAPVVVLEEPYPYPAPAVVQEPTPVIEPVAAVAGGSIMAQPANSFAVQVYAGGTKESVTRYQEAHGLEDLWTVKTDRDGSTIYVLVSVQPDRASAEQAAADLEQRTGSKPWVRSMAGLQKIAFE